MCPSGIVVSTWSKLPGEHQHLLFYTLCILKALSSSLSSVNIMFRPKESHSVFNSNVKSTVTRVVRLHDAVSTANCGRF